MNPVLIAYIPVLHQGYRQWFERHPEADTCLILSREVATSRIDYLRKDLRALNPTLVVSAVQSWGFFPKVAVLDEEGLRQFAEHPRHVVMPNDDISRALAGKELERCETTFDPVFLRWDRDSARVNKEIVPDRVVSGDSILQSLVERASIEAEHSSDWWRQVAAILIREDGTPLLIAHNHHLPTPHEPYAVGDTRACFKRGLHIDLCTAIHAEASVISTAARQGIRTEGLSVVVTTFPCPPCAKVLAEAGIKRLYFVEGYAMLDAESVLRDAGVEIVQIVPQPSLP